MCRYAKISKDMRSTFGKFTAEYFTQRKALAMVFLLIDSSVPPQKVDLDYASQLADTGIAFSIIFTKVDKRKKQATTNQRNMKDFKRALLARGFEYLPPSVVTSAENGTGKGQLLSLIASLREAFEKSGKLSTSKAAEQPDEEDTFDW